MLIPSHCRLFFCVLLFSAGPMAFIGFFSVPSRSKAQSDPRNSSAGSKFDALTPGNSMQLMRGNEVYNLYRVIGAGIATTGMPAWVDALEPDELWGLAYYVRSLSGKRPYRIDPAAYELRPSPHELLPAAEDGSSSDETTGGE